MKDDAISRQAAVNTLKRESQADGAYGYLDTKSIVDALERMPSADAVEVVRCKGCKHYRDYGCQRAFVYPKPDDFCSYGERADG